MLNFKLDYKVELISDNEALVHRRILTPFFYIKLSTFVATFKEWKQPWLWLPALWFPLIVPLPDNCYWFLGQWEVKEKRFDLPELEAIHKSYGNIKKLK